MEAGFDNGSLSTKFGFIKLGFFIFYQRWTELFDHKTIDTYQYRVLNGHWLMWETLRVIELIKTGTIKHANLPDILRETNYRIKQDICLKKHNLPLWGRIISNLDKVPQDKDRAALIRLEYQLKHTLSLISGQYLEWLLSDLKNAIDNDELDSVEILTGFLASELVNNGWSPRSLNRLVKYICFISRKGSLNDMWRSFTQEIAAPIQTFQCYYLCHGNSDILANIADIKIVSGENIINTFPDAAPHISSSANYIHIMTNARYHDLHSATEQTKQYIAKLQALVNYNIINLSIENKPIVVFPNGSKCLPYNHDDVTWKKTAKFDHPYYVTLEGLNQVLSSSEIETNGLTKLMNLLRQYHIGIEALSPETWFTNLWIAMESFVVTGQHSSIIEHVKKLVPSILCSTYIYHLLKNFLGDCNKNEVIPKYNGTEINTSKPTFYDIEMLLNILRNEGDLNILIGLCSGYSLLQWRCQSLAKSIKDNKSIKNLIENHYKNIAWHMQRLYRIRNTIIHSSNTDSNILPLAGHLNYYIRVIVAQIVYRLSSGNFKSLDELFSCFEDNYLATIEILNDKAVYPNEIALKGPLFC